MRFSRQFVVLSCALSALSTHATAQCLAPLGGFDVSGATVTVRKLVVADDGSGDALYAAGDFAVMGSAYARGVAKFDGVSWQALAGSNGIAAAPWTASAVKALIGFDDGSGWALWAAGDFAQIGGYALDDVARWRPATGWETAGHLPLIEDFAVLTTSSGNSLYAGGYMHNWSGSTFNGLARWNGSAWAPLPTGGVLGGFAPVVSALESFDDGSGPALYTAGSFSSAGGVPANAIAKYDGATFSPLGAGLIGRVYDLFVFDDGSGPALYAGGNFSLTLGGPVANVAKWNGASWSTVGAGLPFRVRALGAVDDGSPGGKKLVAGGDADGVAGRLARFDAGAWTTLGAEPNFVLHTLASFDAGAGEKLYVGGDFVRIGVVQAPRIARWDAGAWTPAASGQLYGTRLKSAVAFDDGSGPAIYTNLGPLSRSVQRWNGLSWSQVGASAVGSLSAIDELAVFDDGSGPALFAAGDISAFGATPVDGLARWSNGAWVGTGTSGLSDVVHALAVYDDGSGSALYVAGTFNNGQRVRRFDGTTWSNLHPNSNPVGTVYALEVFDDGSGPALYAGGEFTTGGGSPRRLARWKGSTWELVVGSPDGAVRALAVYRDSLCIGGDFTSVAGVPATRIARYSAGAWSALGNGVGFDSSVRALATVRDGLGESLYAGGNFSSVDGAQRAYLARFDGSQWGAPPFAVDAGVLDLEPIAAGPVGMPSLWLGGAFNTLGSTTSAGAGALVFQPSCTPTTYCTPKTNSLGCVPTLAATGVASLGASTLQVNAAQVLNNKAGLLFWGLGANAAPFQGGTLCVDAPLKRTSMQSSGGNPAPDDCSGGYSYSFTSGYLNAQGLAAGDGVFCQYWSRDPASASTTGLTAGVHAIVYP